MSSESSNFGELNAFPNHLLFKTLNPKFRELGLKNLFDESISKLCIILNEYPNDVSGNAINNTLYNCKRLVDLSVIGIGEIGRCYVSIGDEEPYLPYSKIAPAIATLPQLKSLKIFGIRDVMSISDSLKILTGLTTLDLSQNYINKNDVICLAPALKDLTKLESLDLSTNSIGPDGIKTLAPYLKDLTGLTYLNLSQNCIDVGSTSLALALKDLTRLRSLNLADGCIREVGMTDLALVMTDLTGLTYLNLASNNIRGAGTSLALALTRLTGLIYLDLSWNWIWEAGIESLAISLRQLTCLQSLNLSGINNGGNEYGHVMLSFCPAIKDLRGITSLNISCNSYRDAEIACLAMTLRELTGLKSLDLSRTSYKCIHLITKDMTGLESLNLSGNWFGDAEITYLAIVLQDLTGIQSLHLSDIYIYGIQKENLSILSLPHAIKYFTRLHQKLLRPRRHPSAPRKDFDKIYNHVRRLSFGSLQDRRRFAIEWM